MAAPLPNTLRNVVHSVTDFLTVAIHTILYERNIYPDASFVSTRKYNIPVRQNRHPKVCEWVNDAVHSVEVQLLKGAVERVAVVIFSKDADALERFVFDMSRIPAVPAADIDVTMIREGVDEELSAILPVVDMDEQFRAVISKIANCKGLLRALPKQCTYTIAIELRKEGHHAPLVHPQAWIPGEVDDEGSSQLTEDDQQPTTTPLRTVKAGELNFEAWIEESAVKEKVCAEAESTNSSFSFSDYPRAEG